MVFISLINNIALLVALGLTNRLLLQRWRDDKVLYQVVSGILFGMVTIIGMMNSLKIMPGLIFDGRSIVLSLAGVFGGPITAIISMLIGGLYRYYIGGPGVVMGLLVIVESGFLGIAYRYLRGRWDFFSGAIGFLLLGVIVHLIMITLMYTLPGQMTFEVISLIALPVLTIYPLSTVLLAWLFKSQESHEEALSELKDSEKRFRQLFYESQAMQMILRAESGEIIDVNKSAEIFYGWSKEELIKKTIFEINIWDKERISVEMEKASLGKKNYFVMNHKVATGEVKVVEVFSGPITMGGQEVLYSIIHDVTDRKKVEDELARERKLMQSLIENLPDALSVKDLSLKKLLANDAEIKLSQFVSSYTIGEEVKPKWVAQFEDINASMEQKVLASGLSQNLEFELVSERGVRKWLHVLKTPLSLYGLPVDGLISIIKDVTPWKQALENLKLSEKSYKGLFDAVPVGLFIQDQNGTYLDVNTEASMMYGAERSDFIGKPMNYLSAPDKNDFTEIQIHFQRALEGEKRSYSYWGIRLNGEIFQQEVVLFKGVYFGEEVVIHIARDVSEYVKNEAMLRESRQNLDLLLNVSEDLIVLLDNEYHIITYNTSFLKAIGDGTPIEGKNFSEISSPDLFATAYESLQIVRQQCQKISYEEHFRERNWWVTFYPILDGNGEIERYAVYARDITNRVKLVEMQNSLEIAKKASEAKQKFLANISHEMRTPMNGIIGMTDILSRTQLNEQQEGFVQTIRESSRSLLMMINDVLDLSKFESGKMSLDVKVIDSSVLIKKISDLFSNPVEGKGLDFIINRSPDWPDFFIGDEKRLIQVITNLLGNAIKFTDQGYIKVIFQLQNENEENLELKIKVEDTGVGIQSENLDKIFEEFTQSDDSPTRIYEGTGLGLAICKRIVEMMDGSIGVNSKYGLGSTFWFIFKSSKAIVISDEKKDKEEEQKPLDLNILLVEDKKINRQVAGLLLDEMGCRVDTAENGLLGIEKIMKQNYDVVFMDIQMPVMDGVTAVKNLRAMNVKLPVIIGLSAEAMEGDAEKYVAVGMDDYITKPLIADILYRKLKFWKSKIAGSL